MAWYPYFPVFTKKLDSSKYNILYRGDAAVLYLAIYFNGSNSRILLTNTLEM